MNLSSQDQTTIKNALQDHAEIRNYETMGDPMVNAVHDQYYHIGWGITDLISYDYALSSGSYPKDLEFILQEWQKQQDQEFLDQHPEIDPDSEYWDLDEYQQFEQELSSDECNYIDYFIRVVNKDCLRIEAGYSYNVNQFGFKEILTYNQPLNSINYDDLEDHIQKAIESI